MEENLTFKTFDHIWEDKYQSGHAQRYPWDVVVSFVFRNRPQEKTPAQTRILEVGCGTASNLWFAAREGFSVAGLEGSTSAIETAKKRFATDRLEGDLQVGDFTATYPWPAGSFDLAVDRCALIYTGFYGATKAIKNVHKMLTTAGKFLCVAYSDKNLETANATSEQDGMYSDISGPLAETGDICFWTEESLADLFPADQWTIRELDHISHISKIDQEQNLHMWRIVAEKR